MRVECRTCGRKFAPDRVARHQRICQESSEKRSRKTFEPQRAYSEGGSEGRVVAYSRVGHAPMPDSLKSTWRQQSAALQEGCRAARRQGPLPRWGEDSPTCRGGRRQGASRADPSLSPARGLPRRRLGGGFGGSGHGLPRSGPPSRCVSPRSAPVSPASSSPKRAQRRGQELAHRHRPEEVARLKSEFRRLDADGDGTLDKRELGRLLRAGDPHLSDSEVQMLFKQVDRDGNGRIDFVEFVDYVFGQPGPHTSPTRSKPGFGSRAQASNQPSPTRSSVGERTCRTASVVANSTGRHRAASGPQSVWRLDPKPCGRECMTGPPEGCFAHSNAWAGFAAVSSPARSGGTKSSLCPPGRILAVRSGEG